VKDLEEKFQLAKIELASIADSKKELAEKLEHTSIALEEKVKADVEQKKLIEEIKHNTKSNEEEFNSVKVSYEETLKNLTSKNEDLTLAAAELQVKIWAQVWYMVMYKEKKRCSIIYEFV